MATPRKGGRKSTATRRSTLVAIKPEALVAGVRTMVQTTVREELDRERSRETRETSAIHPPRIDSARTGPADPKPDGALQVASRRVSALEHDTNLIRCVVQSALSRIHGSAGQSLGGGEPRSGDKTSNINELFTSIDNLSLQVAALTQEVNDLVNPL